MNPQFPPFSVLLSVYAKDNPVWVAQALDSVLNNTVRPTEVAVAVDGPIPEELHTVLEEYAQKYPQIKLVPLERNSGLGMALQKGLEQCSYELVARMDADDISLPDRFEKQLTRFAQEPDLAVLGGTIEEIDAESLQPVAIRRVPGTDAECKKFLKMRCPFNHMTVMFKKSLILQAGSYQPFHLMEDYYLWARCAAKGYHLGNLADIVLKARVNAAMYGRRGGWKYFKSNFALAGQLRQLGIIGWGTYIFNVCVRFCVQVLMPNSLREMFYKKTLRTIHD